MEAARHDGTLTIETLWQYLGTNTTKEKEEEEELINHLLNWPPDLFALCAAVMKKSGAYTKTMNILGSGEAIDEGRAKAHQEAGRMWRSVLEGCSPSPANDPMEIKALGSKTLGSILKKVYDLRKTELFRISDNRELSNDLMDLLAIADEACSGVGLPIKGTRGSVSCKEGYYKQAAGAFHKAAEQALFPKQFGSTLCKMIHPSVARVLPKMHTAQAGLTLRSFSHNLAYCESDEVRPSWISVPGSRGDSRDVFRLNLLIAPWPQQVTPTQISEVNDGRKLPYNRFEVEVEATGGEAAKKLSALVGAAKALVGPIDAVVLPELSMTTQDYRTARSVMLSQKIMFFVGVGSKRRSANYLNMDIPISSSHALRLRQRKHHRWKLDENQINQYQLGSRLRPDKMYWEHIDVQDRQLKFIVLRPWLVATPLICEDLARHDPVGDLIKGVGPNLVLALLMDGPQLTGRWPGRYAAVLADDPGCSVLSITSLGMAKLSKSRDRDKKDASRVVGLWKEAYSSGATEIAIEQGHDGVVLTLAMRQREEKTADSRSDNGLASYPSLSGINYVKMPDKIPELDLPLREPQWLSAADARHLAELAQAPFLKDLEEEGSNGENVGKLTSHVPDGMLKHAMQAEIMPEGLNRLEGSAFRIGREIWRQKTKGTKARIKKDLWIFDRKPFAGEQASKSEEQANVTQNNQLVFDDGAIDGGWATAEEEETAKEIINWDETNRNPELSEGMGPNYR